MDLEHAKSHVARNEMVLNAFAKEKFSEGLAAKTDFYKRLENVLLEHYTKHEQFFKNEFEQKRAFYDSLDQKTISLLLEHQINMRQKVFDTHVKVWLEIEPNKDLFKEWSKDKINQDFIEKWLKHNKSIKNLK